MKRICRIYFLIVMLIAAGCILVNTEGDPTDAGNPTGNPATQIIGPEGGTLVSEDGKVTLTVPEQAVSSETEFSVQPITNNLHGGIGGAYRIESGGTALNHPVQIVFQYTDDNLSGTSPEALGLAYQDEEGIWYKLQDTIIDTDAKTVAVSTDHLSDWAMRADYRLKPGSATVKVGEEVGLELIYCSWVAGEETDPELAPLPVKKCTEDGEFSIAQATEWSVNGILGGNSTVGTIDVAGRINAAYKAPQAVPEPNTVSVSARVEHPAISSSQKVLAVSSITIIGDDLEGVFSVTHERLLFDERRIESVSGTLHWELLYEIPDTPVTIALRAYKLTQLEASVTQYETSKETCVVNNSPADISINGDSLLYIYPTLKKYVFGVRMHGLNLNATCTRKEDGEVENTTISVMMDWDYDLAPKCIAEGGVPSFPDDFVEYPLNDNGILEDFYNLEGCNQGSVGTVNASGSWSFTSSAPTP